MSIMMPPLEYGTLADHDGECRQTQANIPVAVRAVGRSRAGAERGCLWQNLGAAHHLAERDQSVLGATTAPIVPRNDRWSWSRKAADEREDA